MNKKIIFIVLALAVLVGFFFLLGKGNITNYPPKEGSIVIFGDSLVEGVGASKGKDLGSLLSAKVGEPIINLGVSGNTTAQGLARIDKVLKEEPRIVILLLGGNDYLRKVPIDETFSNLRTIIQRIQSEGAIVLLLGIRGGLLTDQFDSRFEDLADETGSAHVSNVLSGLLGDQRYMSDAIHPNDAGYTKISDRVYPVLKKLLR